VLFITKSTITGMYQNIRIAQLFAVESYALLILMYEDNDKTIGIEKCFRNQKYHHQPTNVPISGAQAFLMGYKY
jgi:hypothetical protein